MNVAKLDFDSIRCFLSLQTVLHWGAKHGNSEIIKVFAGTYKVDVNAKTVSNHLLK